MRSDGIHALTRAEYDAVDRVNFSSLKHIARSPAHYRHRLEHRDEGDTDARRLGRATHMAILEPERFGTEWVQWDGGRRAGKLWDEFVSIYGEENILTPAQWDRCEAMGAAVRSDPVAMRYLSEGAAEQTILWRASSPDLGATKGYEIDCKGRVDWLGPAIVDLKTCRDGSPEGFGRAAWALKMIAQAAFYVDGVEAVTAKRLPYVLIAVESEAPHVVTVCTVPERYLGAGREEYRGWLDRLALCRRENRWPGYVTGETELLLPKWAGFDNENDLSDLDLVFE